MDTKKNSLIFDIEKTRMEMMQLAHVLGFTSPAVIQCSQKLDLLLNVYREKFVH